MKPTIFWILLGGDGLSRAWGVNPSPSISRHFGHPSACCWARLVRGTVSSENSSENGGKIGWNPSFLMFSDGFLMCSLHSLLCHYVFVLIMEKFGRENDGNQVSLWNRLMIYVHWKSCKEDQCIETIWDMCGILTRKGRILVLDGCGPSCFLLVWSR